MTKWNSVKVIGTGFEYAIRGNESEGFKITVMGRKNPNVFRTLADAHRVLNVMFNHYMKERQHCQSVRLS